MKIVYCIPATSNSGGMERVLSGKANYLASLGHEIAIITTDQRGKAPFFPFREEIAQYDLTMRVSSLSYVPIQGRSVATRLCLPRS